MLRVLKRIRHAPVSCVPVLVVVSQSLADVLEFLWRLYCMCIVVAQNSLSVGLVQCQCIANSMRYFLRRDNTPSFDLDPISAILIDDLIVEVNQGFNTRVIAHIVVYHLMILLLQRVGWAGFIKPNINVNLTSCNIDAQMLRVRLHHRQSC